MLPGHLIISERILSGRSENKVGNWQLDHVKDHNGSRVWLEPTLGGLQGHCGWDAERKDKVKIGERYGVGDSRRYSSLATYPLDQAILGPQLARSGFFPNS